MHGCADEPVVGSVEPKEQPTEAADKIVETPGGAVEAHKAELKTLAGETGARLDPPFNPRPALTRGAT